MAKIKISEYSFVSNLTEEERNTSFIDNLSDILQHKKYIGTVTKKDSIFEIAEETYNEVLHVLDNAKIMPKTLDIHSLTELILYGKGVCEKYKYGIVLKQIGRTYYTVLICGEDVLFVNLSNENELDRSDGLIINCKANIEMLELLVEDNFKVSLGLVDSTVSLYLIDKEIVEHLFKTCYKEENEHS